MRSNRRHMRQGGRRSRRPGRPRSLRRRGWLGCRGWQWELAFVSSRERGGFGDYLFRVGSPYFGVPVSTSNRPAASSGSIFSICAYQSCHLGRQALLRHAAHQRQRRAAVRRTVPAACPDDPSRDATPARPLGASTAPRGTARRRRHRLVVIRGSSNASFLHHPVAVPMNTEDLFQPTPNIESIIFFNHSFKSTQFTPLLALIFKANLAEK